MTHQRIASALAVLISSASAQRTIVDFGLGWRHHLGNPSANATCTPSQTFPLNYTNVQCDGLTAVPSAIDAVSCQNACCGAPGCQIWQFWPGTQPCSNGACCWIGQIVTCNPGNGWISFANNNTSPFVPAPAMPSYDDSTWEAVDQPHDPRIEGTFDPTADKGQAFLRANVSWYRKHFSVPAAWQGMHVRVVVEGAFSVSQWYLNGAPVGTKNYGYTSVVLRLDNVTGASALNYGGPNVLSAYVDATVESGWWYEGSGLYRRSYILATSPVHVENDGVFAPAYILGSYHPRATPAQGLTADQAIVNPSVTLTNTGSSNGVKAQVTFTLTDISGNSVGSSTVDATLNASQTTTVKAPALKVTSPELWSIPRPYLYSLVTTVTVGGVLADNMTTSIGLRSIAWDPETGLFINEQPVKMRGYCNHNSFTSFGVGVAERANLLRLQQVRGMGGNAWRASHNPPAPALLDMMARLGVVILDENRLFEVGQQYVQNMAELVLRDRNNPAVIFWSFCNEVGCGDGSTEPTLDFKTITYELDGSRVVTGNMCTGWGTCSYVPGQMTNMSILLDMQGFSHVDTGIFQDFHAQAPDKALVASECCSCETMRGEDEDLPHNSSLVFYSNFNADCVSQQTQWSNALQYVTGSFVWTAHDYYGEPDNWPHISSSFGSYDLAGFPKAPVWWYRSWWLANVSTTAADRPPVPGTDYFVHIVESWQAPATGSTRNIHVYSNAPFVRLSVNGSPITNAVQPMPAFGWVLYNGVPYSPGSVTADAIAADGVTVVASESKASWGAPSSIVLSLDAPNAATGTGGAVYLDGSDVGLIRATVVDAAGNVCHDSTANVTFTVTAGPGFVYGTGNGDPNNHDPAHTPVRVAYHGVVRGIVRVNIDASGSDADRALRAAINVEAGHGPRSSGFLPSGQAPPTNITVTASAAGLPTASMVIPLSVDPSDSVMAVAAASVGAAFISE